MWWVVTARHTLGLFSLAADRLKLMDALQTCLLNHYRFWNRARLIAWHLVNGVCASDWVCVYMYGGCSCVFFHPPWHLFTRFCQEQRASDAQATGRSVCLLCSRLSCSLCVCKFVLCLGTQSVLHSSLYSEARHSSGVWLPVIVPVYLIHRISAFICPWNITLEVFCLWIKGKKKHEKAENVCIYKWNRHPGVWNKNDESFIINQYLITLKTWSCTYFLFPVAISADKGLDRVCLW